MILFNAMVAVYWVSVLAFYGTLLHLAWSVSPQHGAALVALFLATKAARFSVTTQSKELLQKKMAELEQIIKESTLNENDETTSSKANGESNG